MAGRRWAFVLAAVAGAAVAGCGSSVTGAGTAASAPDMSVLGMLRLVPSGSGMITVNLYQQAATSTGIQPIAAHSSADAIGGYFGQLNQRAGVAGSDLTQTPGVDTTGVDLADMHADVTAGEPPNQMFAALGTFDTGAIDSAAHADKTWSSALSTAQDDGVTVYRWLPNNNVDLSRGVGILDQLPGSRRLAVANGKALLLTRNDTTMHRMLDATTGKAGSAASDPDIAKTAGELDRLHAYSATITTQQPTVVAVLGTHATPAAIAALRQRLAGQLLRPYRLAGLGVTQANGKPTMLVVLVNADDATAQANATTLRAVVQRGTSTLTNEPWSNLLTLDDVHTDGNLTIATLTEKSAGLWSRILLNNDSLLMRS